MPFTVQLSLAVCLICACRDAVDSAEPNDAWACIALTTRSLRCVSLRIPVDGQDFNMDLNLPREIDAPAVIADVIGGETLIINLNTGSYFVIPPESLAVWSALSTGVPAAALLNGDDDPRTEALTAYVIELAEAGLLRVADHAETATEISWQPDDLGVDHHTDMADLLGLDPIHDADDNVGWPMRKPE